MTVGARGPRLVLAVGAALLTVGACTSDGAERHEVPSTFALEADSATEARIERVLTELRQEVRFTNAPDPRMTLAERMAHFNVPGLAIAVVDDFTIDWARAYGRKRSDAADPVTLETLFHGKSVSKPLAATLTLRLAERGTFALDVVLDSLLESWNVPDNEYTRRTSPTLRHLLSHTAGFTEWGVDSFTPSEPLPTLLETIRGETPEADTVTVDFEPGTAWRYSGGGYGVLQQLLVDVTGTSFPALMDSLIFRPLGMRHSFYPLRFSRHLEPFAATGHDVEGDPIPGGYEILPIQAAGGIWTTAPDLARFLIALARSWSDGGTILLSRSTAREMMNPVRSDWGLGVQVDTVGGALRFSHTGSGDGFKAILVGYPELGAGAVILANADGAGELRYELLRSLAREYGWPGYARQTYTLGESDSVILSRFVGRYQWSSEIVETVRLGREGLETRFDDDGRFRRLLPVGERRFVTWSNEVYEFVGDSAGVSTDLVWRGEDGEEFRAGRIE